MSRTITLTEREAALLEGLVRNEIDVTQDEKRTARTRISNSSNPEDVRKALEQYDYFVEQLHALRAILPKLTGIEGGADDDP